MLRYRAAHKNCAETTEALELCAEMNVVRRVCAEILRGAQELCGDDRSFRIMC